MKRTIRLTESEKNRILGMHNAYKSNPRTWVIREAYSGKPGEKFTSVEACKKQLPYNVATTLGINWNESKKGWGSDGSQQQNLVLRNAMCDGWRIGDTKDSISEPEISNQVKVDFIYSWLQKMQISEDFLKSKVTINYIQSLPAEFINAWYLHCKNTVQNSEKWTFVYNNQTYDSLSGKMILNYNPLVTNYRINKGVYVFEDRDEGEKFIKNPSEGAIGKPTQVQYQSDKNIVWCYFPNLGFGGEYKFIATTNLIKV